MASFFRHLRLGLRLHLRNPGAALAIMLTLGIGIGLNTAVFSLVNALLLQPLAVRSPDRLVRIYSAGDNSMLRHEPLAYPDFEDLAGHNRSLQDLAGFAIAELILQRDARARPVVGELVSGNYFAALGVQPQLGRFFTGEESEGRGLSAVLSAFAWERHFGANPEVLGSTLHINGSPVRIVGVAERQFRGLTIGLIPEIWLPLRALPQLRDVRTVSLGGATPGSDALQDRVRRWVWAIGRLRPSVGLEQAQSDLQSLARQLQREYPASNRGRSIELAPLSAVRLVPQADQVLRPASSVLMWVAGLVLAIAASNASALLLAQAWRRRREMAVRRSLGASRRQLIGQMLAESLSLAAAGGALGLLLAWGCNTALNALQLPRLWPLSLQLSLNGWVVAFALALSLGTVLLFGLAPALQASRAHPAQALGEESALLSSGRRRQVLQGTLVTFQVALCLLLLISAALLTRSLWQASRISAGFEPDGVAAAFFSSDYSGRPDATRDFYDELQSQAASFPGIESTAYATHLPLTYELLQQRVAAAGRTSAQGQEWIAADQAGVSPGYFQTLGVQILRGRGFQLEDGRPGADAAIVNQTLASILWPGQDPLGRQLRTEGAEKPKRVVGVAANGKYRTLGEPPRPFLYRPLTPGYPGRRVLVARSRTDAQATLALLQRSVNQVSTPESPALLRLQTLNEASAESLLLPRAALAFFGLFSLLGLILAMVGLWGLVSQSALARLAEAGIRMALGATPWQVASLLMRQSLAWTLAGIAIGIACALSATRILSAVLYSVSPTDLGIFVIVPSLLALVSLIAAYLPVRSVSSTEAIANLRR